MKLDFDGVELIGASADRAIGVTVPRKMVPAAGGDTDTLRRGSGAGNVCAAMGDTARHAFAMTDVWSWDTSGVVVDACRERLRLGGYHRDAVRTVTGKCDCMEVGSLALHARSLAALGGRAVFGMMRSKRAQPRRVPVAVHFCA